MHGFDDVPRAAESAPLTGPWYKSLNRYHWFVLVVAALGWLFDTMDQHDRQGIPGPPGPSQLGGRSGVELVPGWV